VGGSVESFVGQVVDKFDARVVGKFVEALMSSSGDRVVVWLDGRAISTFVVCANSNG
jgi:hypothetical protein